jgi:hypothetical protein
VEIPLPAPNKRQAFSFRGGFFMDKMNCKRGFKFVNVIDFQSFGEALF